MKKNVLNVQPDCYVSIQIYKKYKNSNNFEKWSNGKSGRKHEQVIH